jgi:pimeloyl-ACP methyl ester carboxylesterase
MSTMLASILALAVLALGALRPAPAEAGAATPAPDTGFSAVVITAADGGPIGADVYGSGPRGVVLLHGGRFDRTSWRPQAQVLARAGFRVVAIDFRAAVDARAGRETACLYDAACLARDALAAVRYLRDGGATSVAIVGGSLGGGAAAQAAIEAVPGQIDRVVLLAHMTIGHPERLRVPALFIVARDDANAGGPRLPGIRAQYDQATGPKELVVLDGDAHAQFLFDTSQGEALLQRILRFLDAAPAGR